MHGCVPLIISNRLQPPFHQADKLASFQNCFLLACLLCVQLFDWSKVAFFMREDALPHLFKS